MGINRYERHLFHGASGNASLLEYSVKCEYLGGEIGKGLHQTYDNIIGKLVTTANNTEPWLPLPKISLLLQFKSCIF